MEEPNLDERITTLESLCAAPPHDADVPELTGLLGGSYLERYETESLPAALDAAIDKLHAAVALAPEHPDLAWWCQGLASAYSYRATARGLDRDYDAAVDWFGRLHALIPAADPDHDEAAVMLMDAHWDRYFETRHGEALSDAQELVSALGRFQIHTNLLCVGYSRLLLGLAKLACFDVGGDRRDLAAGLELLVAALDALPAETPRYVFAACWLIEAYRQRAALDDSPADLDLAIATGERTLREETIDDYDRQVLERVQAESYELRWDRSADPADLDRAIALWRGVLERNMQAWPAKHCGHLLRRRAEVSQDATDLPEAVRLLGFAAEESAPDDPEGWLCWRELAQTHCASWDAAHDPQSLADAARCADIALEREPPAGEDTLVVHSLRLIIAVTVLKHEIDQHSAATAPAVARLERCLADGRTALDAAQSALAEVRAMLAVLLAHGEMLLTYRTMDDLDVDRVRSMITRAAELSGASGNMRGLADVAEGLFQQVQASLDPDAKGDHGVARIVRAALMEPVDEIMEVARNMQPLALQARAKRSSEIRAAERLLRERDTDLTTVGMAALAEMFGALDTSQQGDYASAADLSERARAALNSLQPSLATERTFLPMGRFLQAMDTAGTDRRPAAQRLPNLPLGRVLTDRELGEQVLAVGAQLSAARDGSGVVTLRECIARLAEIADRTQTGHPARMFAASLAGMSELETARRDSADGAAAARSVAWLEEVAAAIGPGHPLWTQVALALAEGLRRSGTSDLDRSRQLGMSALQPGTGHALEPARAASARAHMVAGWCLADRAYEEAVAVLDAGRGLALRSMTARPLTAAGVEDIHAALATTGADALVYLVPASDSLAGCALVVPARGPIELLTLPGLHTGTYSPLASHVQSLEAQRDLPPGAPRDSRHRKLDELCRWAWQTAAQVLVGHVRNWELGRPAHLVLIPMGSLALVPWHAAYAQTARGRHYAVQDIIFSYTVSAQMFCESAAHPLQPSQSALVVGNPSGDLPFAGAEAQAVHSQFYPQGRYLGLPRAYAHGAATPDEILQWLTSAATGPSTLHLACAARTGMSKPAGSHLLLDGGILDVRHLLDAARLAALVINRVFLPACTTNVSGADYDEAFSLAAVFLAVGAHTVFGSLWPVLDEDTSVLMYMVHHHLNAEPCSPAQALHRAQLWMLDPARRIPDAMPPRLRLAATRAECADPLSWAAYTHLGR